MATEANDVSNEQYRTLTPRGKKSLPHAEWVIEISLSQPCDGDPNDEVLTEFVGCLRINDAYTAANPANLGRCVAAFVEEQAHKILAERKGAAK